ncbi:MAG: type II toxin-antitoxin system RelE/ParE family toxin [Pseudomonadota bacterium]|nr:type II toxin-antitoxin system RelE/ParE family toxin [Gammaproteobacteria bacterium]MDQ3582929.1 type II toxin-antitoxin system RelE/ParE family toxin [Pseudomonadota bacterium]
MKRPRFVAAARREFLAEVIYYNNKQPGLGSRFAEAVEEATARALAFPLAGSPASKNTRRVFLKDFPFSVVYRPAKDGVVVFALAHHSRRPDYWLPRVQER